MLAPLLPYLSCPHCGTVLAPARRSLRCASGHTFDVARQGYVSLLPGNARTGSADTAAMVHARERFLAAGHYAAMADAVAALAADAVAGVPGCIAEVGAGTGYYLGTVLDRLPDAPGVALDISKYALRRAARAHPRAGAVGCDVWHSLPLRTGSAALVLNVFAPRNGPEAGRVLRDDGALLVVAPTAEHLRELVTAVGMLTVDERKPEQIDEQLRPHFLPAQRRAWERQLRLSRADAAALVAMGPSAHHTGADAVRRRIARLPEPLAVTASVTLSLYRPLRVAQGYRDRERAPEEAGRTPSP